MKKYILSLLLAVVVPSAMAVSPVVTPALKPPSGGQIHCLILNASKTKTIEVEWGIYSFDGTALFGPIKSTLNPLSNTRSGNSVTAQSSCVATVTKGGKSNLRLTLVADDSSGNVTAAVQGQ